MSKGGKRGNQRALTPRNTQGVAVSKVEASSFQGPLPPPQILNQYELTVPGSAERIISLWESQVRHRQELEKKAIGSDIRQSYFGSILGFIVAMSAIGAGTFLAYTGHPTEGVSAIISALVGLVGVFGWGSYQRRKERNARINQ
jgi:uncharacterized membrane protein